ncbi:MAG: hypothetical protein NW218_19450 [Saprospiraceae bacterium]|nr:hypothetical protein [Saprospiraceae bacterium]
MNLFLNLSIAVISPFFNLLRQRSTKSKYIASIMFVTIAGTILNFNESADGLVYDGRVKNYYLNMDIQTFLIQLFEIMTFNETEIGVTDLYIHIVSYISGGILCFPPAFWIIVGFVYAYFYIGSIFMLKKYIGKLSFNYLFFFFVLVLLSKSIDGINTVRTWTGFWFLFYFNLKFALTKQSRYFILSLFAPFFHIMYLAVIIPIITSHFIYKNNLIVSGILSFSILFKSLDITSLYQKLGYIFESVNNKAAAYNISNADIMLKELISTTRWYVGLYAIGLQNYVIMFLYFIIIFQSKTIKITNYKPYYFLNTGALIMSLSNFSGNNVSLAGRSAICALIFMLSGICMIISENNNTKNKNLYVLASIALVPYFIFRIADIYYFVSIWLFIFPFIPWIDPGLNVSIESIVAYFLK